MRGRTASDNVWDQVSLLAKLGVVEDFFDLASLDVDRDGEFRGLLIPRRRRGR